MGMGEQKKILVIEDDISIQRNLQRLLELKGFLVLCANNGKEGLDVLKSADNIDLILLDLMMPVMDGHEFISSLDSSFAIPIIVLTAGRDEVNSELVSKIIRKPFQLLSLLETVKQFTEAE